MGREYDKIEKTKKAEKLMRLIILGAGGFGHVVADLARQSGTYEEIFYLDDGKMGPEILDRCETFAAYIDENTQLYPAFGNNAGRVAWLDRLEAAGAQIPTIIHPRAYVSPESVVEPGNMILPMAIVNTGCRICRGCIIDCAAVVDHGCVLEEGIHLASGSVVRAENRVPRLTLLEANKVIFPRSF